MKKNRLFILSSFLIIISLFATAAACSLCGVPIEIGEATEEEIEGKTERKQQTTGTSQGQTQSTEAASNGNNPPVIQEIELMGMDVEAIEAEGGFDDIVYPGVEVSDAEFTIEATDEDGDDLQYRVYDSLGASFDVTKTDNYNAEFMWSFPDVIGEYTLTVEVSDGKGGIDTQTINMSFADMVADLDLPDGDESGDEIVDLIPPEEGGASPEVSNIVILELATGTVALDIFEGHIYTVLVEATDPDGVDEELIYDWSSDQGGFTHPHDNPSAWGVDHACECTITVTVRDGAGNETVRSRTITVEEI